MDEVGIDVGESVELAASAGRGHGRLPERYALLQLQIESGVHGLFILGTTGEAPSLSHRLRHEFVERVCTQVAGRVPVFVGITDTSFVESLNLARKSAEAGAAADEDHQLYRIRGGRVLSDGTIAVIAAVGDGTQAVLAPAFGWPIFCSSMSCIRSGIAHMPLPICAWPDNPHSSPISTFQFS